MRKIPTEFENPFDNYILDMADYTVPYFYKAGLTPNTITTLSNITTILVIILLLNAKYFWAAFFVLVAYFFDCADGHMARTYKMTSIFGDYYDHISDAIKVAAILITLYYINPDKLHKILPVIIVAAIGCGIHMGCQELIYDSDESPTLSVGKKLCPVKDGDREMVEKVIKSTRLFGCGTGQVLMALCIIYYAY